MAHALSITDGTTTISLSSSGCVLTNYVPVGPETDSAGAYKPVTEAIEFIVTDTTTALIQTKLNAIERVLIVTNQRRLTGTGPRAYLQFQAHGEAAAVRSELLSYRLQLDVDAAHAFVQLKLGVRLIVTRQSFWEGARTAIPLTNSNGSNNTSGLTVWNHDDAGTGHDNWANIAGSAVVGSLPAPLELKLANNYGSDLGYENFYIANNIYSQALAHVIEGEDVISGYGSTGSDANCSNSGYVTRTGSGWQAFRWYVPAATLDILRGRYVRALARFRTLSTSDRLLRLTLYSFDGLEMLARSPQVVARGGSAYMQDCGALPMVASGYATGWERHVIELAVKAPASETIAVDFVQLTPTEPLLYRKVIQRGYLTADGDALVDDGIEGVTYYYDPVLELKFLIHTVRNEPVHVWPGVDQRLLFLHDGVAQSIAWKLAVQAWYRPRRTLL